VIDTEIDTAFSMLIMDTIRHDLALAEAADHADLEMLLRLQEANTQ
jgi:hypothetical protein